MKPVLTRQRQWLVNSLKPSDTLLDISDEYYIERSGRYTYVKETFVRANVTCLTLLKVLRTDVYERELTDISPNAFKYIHSERVHSLQIICKNCKSLTAISRYNPYHEYPDIDHVCDECIVKWQGPVENDLMCRNCGKIDGFEPCDCYTKREFMYGGPIVICPVCHKNTVWIDGGSGPGFAGGPVYWERYSCGHMEMDESADIAAAM